MAEAVFPVELEREILETAALLYPCEMPTFLRVAQRVLIWIEPLLYRVIRIGKGPRNREVAAAILNATRPKPASFFKCVRHLRMQRTSPCTLDEVREVLKVCTSVVSLCLFDALSNPGILPVLARMQIQQLSISFEGLFWGSMAIDWQQAPFNSITYLHDFDLFDPPYSPSIEAISRLRPAAVADEYVANHGLRGRTVIHELRARRRRALRCGVRRLSGRLGRHGAGTQRRLVASG
ncbi:hypothetical protein C8R43DRAFT_994160 [Mycena crocata]|nr:hypothetical protein C8R43DRAFT_994160 [Mycena crocata]